MNAQNKPKLDLKDRKILAELDWNARMSNTEIAKKVGLSKKSVEYRISRLEKEEIIEGYYPVINFLKLGNYYERTFIKLQYLDDNIKRKIEEYLRSAKKPKWCVWMNGDYDLGIAIWTKKLKDFKSNFHDFNDKFGKYILKTVFSIAFELDQYPYDFLLGKREKIRELKMTEDEEKISIDKKDFDILKELSKNARQTSSEIARKVKSNYKVVSYRIKRLLKEGILLGTRASINHKKLDKNHYKLFIYFSEDAKKNIEKIKEYLKKMPEIIYFVDDIGMADLDVEVLFDSNKDFFGFVNNLKNNFKDSIRETRYVLFDKTIKISYLPEFSVLKE